MASLNTPPPQTVHPHHGRAAKIVAILAVIAFIITGFVMSHRRQFERASTVTPLEQKQFVERMNTRAQSTPSPSQESDFLNRMTGSTSITPQEQQEFIKSLKQ